MVRIEGVEPPRLAALDPKSSASTSSAISAKFGFKTSTFFDISPFLIFSKFTVYLDTLSLLKIKERINLFEILALKPNLRNLILKF